MTTVNAKGTALSLDDAADLPARVRAALTRIWQILANLLDGAIESTERVRSG
jgi:C4-dicarboxylate-specific signal transduction histidine kinase